MSVVKKAVLVGIDGAQLDEYERLWAQEGPDYCQS